MKRFLAPILIACALFATIPSLGQDAGVSRKQQEKIQAKKGKEDKKAQKKAEKEGMKRHLGIQDKPTRKRLKKNIRKTKKTGQAGHRQPLLKRWFSKKR